MIESVNIIYFWIFTVMLYLYLLLFSIIKINAKAKELYVKIESNVCTIITNNNGVNSVYELIYHKVLPSLSAALSAGVNNLHYFSLYIVKFEHVLKTKGGYYPSEAVNYTALALRKLYDGNPQIWLVYSSLIIVVFYFILTVF
jgi:hypothetical protein